MRICDAGGRAAKGSSSSIEADRGNQLLPQRVIETFVDGD